MPRLVERALKQILRPRVGIPLILMVSLVLAPFLIRRMRLAGLPDVGDPFDVAAVSVVAVDPAENAYPAYEPAFAIFVRGSEAAYNDLEVIKTSGWGAAGPDLRNWAEHNQPALAMFRRASSAREAVYVQPGEFTFNTLLPAIQHLRDFSRLLIADAKRREGAGDIAGAWANLHAGFRASRHSGMHGCMIERLVGVAIHASVAEGILSWSANPDVTAEQLRTALHEVRQAYALTAPAHVMFQVEYLSLRNSLHDLPTVLGAAGISSSATPAWQLRAGGAGLYVLGEPELTRRLLQRVFDNYLAQCDRPFGERNPISKDRIGLFEPDPGAAPGPRAVTQATLRRNAAPLHLIQLIAPSLRCLESTDREQALQREIEVALALQIHYREHGAFPETLDPLSGAELPEIPADPFAAHGTKLRARHEGRGVILWSIGPDRTDDDARVTLKNGGRSGDIVTEVVAPGEPDQIEPDQRDPSLPD